MDRTVSVVSQSLGSLIVTIREYFEFCSDWYHRNPAVSELVGQYYVVLRSLLRQDSRFICLPSLRCSESLYTSPLTRLEKR
jgi:hypothetical protein